MYENTNFLQSFTMQSHKSDVSSKPTNACNVSENYALYSSAVISGCFVRAFLLTDFCLMMALFPGGQRVLSVFIFQISKQWQLFLCRRRLTSHEPCRWFHNHFEKGGNKRNFYFLGLTDNVTSVSFCWKALYETTCL